MPGGKRYASFPESPCMGPFGAWRFQLLIISHAQETGCSASAGISHNLLLARLATKAAKPNGHFWLLPHQVGGLGYHQQTSACSPFALGHRHSPSNQPDVPGMMGYLLLLKHINPDQCVATFTPRC